MDDPRIASATGRLLESVADDARERTARAADLCVRAHHGVRRRSGEPFALHPIAVAQILADLDLSADTVCAGLLHDTVEDTDLTVAEVAEAFGGDVAAIVDGVTKVTAVARRGTAQRSKLATYRKLVLATAGDARVMVVKLADRLHNMRTISALPAPRAEDIARETVEVYAPIAHRLGMWQLAGELADRSLEVLDPDAYSHAEQIQRAHAADAAPRLERMMRALRADLEHQEIPACEVHARVKSVASIAGAIDRHPGGLVEDVLGMRVVCATTEDCYRALGRVHAIWPPLPGRLKDFIAVPKSNLYQSLHTTVAGPSGVPVEVQIRTVAMHEIAERGIAAHWRYKEQLSGGGPPATRRFLDDLAAAQNGASTLEAAYDLLRAETFAQEIWCLTPAGDVLLLPVGACAVDFAYAVHTDIGDRCEACRVDGRLRNVTAPLQSGQTVQIITGTRRRPPREWLDFVSTARARAAIRRHHHATEQDDLVETGRAAIRAQIDRLGVRELRDDLVRVAELAGRSEQQAALEAAADPARARHIARRAAAAAAQTQPPPPPAAASERGRLDDRAVVVDGRPGVATRLAGCCHPEPGDRVVAYLSLAGGGKVHRADCRNVIALRRRRPARVVAADWNSRGASAFRCEMHVRFVNRPRLLLDICEAIDRLGAEVEAARLRVHGHTTTAHIVCLVSQRGQPERLRDAITDIDGALQVRRVRPGRR